MKKLLIFCSIILTTSLFANTLNDGKRIIVLDPGHGGVDGGVKKDDYQEKDIVLEISKLIKSRNPYKDTEFIILRNTDEQISNENRAKIIKSYEPDLVISIHVNSNIKSTVKGLEALVSPMNPCFEDSKLIAEKINKNLISLGFENLGTKESNTKILRDSSAPTVMIHIGHLSNNEDKAIVTNPKNYNTIADQILAALE
ncbi:N-acetylmuramoyl-L-alanine amidase family protein [Faecalibacter rhinopitheci]|uniref:N-acetylmuramoyl-L-alanine amidase n=1 Tax=Faecalibacter rhinopitheci TaxID=2779678 RepID=A0A8J7KI43_9FLAO|nr:N-acetylmuramoyl-L-alanine amidase [Faecalibacter rhinopitheci]MBF0597111.1 N-acetylmuramoyl-L-alanine amidase [Faecalibacter rhinopitheci]